MGFVKKVAKGAKKIVKGAAKAVGSVVQGIGKAFKKVWDSSLGRVALTVAAVWAGGWALGMWGPGTGGAAAAGAGSKTAGATLAAGGDAASIAAGAGSAAASTAGMTATAEAAALGLEGYSLGGGLSTAAGSAATAGGGGAASHLLSASAPGANVPAAAEIAGSGLSLDAAGGATLAGGPSSVSGIVNTIRALGRGARNFAGDVGGFVKENPLVSAMAVQGVGNALTPTPLEQQRKYEEQDRQRWERNLDVAGIDLGVRPSGRSLTSMDGDPVYSAGGGIINRRRFGP